VFFIFSTALGLWIVNKGMKPTLQSYAESTTKKIAPMVIDKAVADVVPNVKDIREIAEIVPNGSGGSAVIFKTDIINKAQSDLAKAIQQNIKYAETGDLATLETDSAIKFDYDKTSKEEGIVYSFPLGQATNNALLGNLGPRIPIKFTAIGNVRTNVKPVVEYHPINNAFITVMIEIEVNIEIIIPFASDIATVHQKVPIAIGYFPGEVPQFYNGNTSLSPSIQLPTDSTP